MFGKLTAIKVDTQRSFGVIGTTAILALFIREPSFPTPDKLIVLIFFIFMAFGQALESVRRFGGFVVVIFVYESFRSVADKLNSYVDYSLAPGFDKLIFGNLPTKYLQDLLWRGYVVWYDYLLYLPYLLHFVMPLGLGILIWKTRDKYFWRAMNAFLLVAFASFLTFLLFPAAPPWLASDNQQIQSIVRVSSDVWASLGIHDFPSLYNRLAPNNVAAIPSMHAAWASLFVIIIYKLYGRRWGLIAAIYPAILFVGMVYTGEHYVFDLLVGMVYAYGAYRSTPWVMNKFHQLYGYLKSKSRRLNTVHLKK